MICIDMSGIHLCFKEIKMYKYKYHHSTKLSLPENITSLLPSVLLRVRSVGNNAKGNKRVMFFSAIAWYYGWQWFYHTRTRLLPLALLLVLCTCNNDDNKLVIFSGIALCYGENYILSINLQGNFRSTKIQQLLHMQSISMATLRMIKYVQAQLISVFIVTLPMNTIIMNRIQLMTITMRDWMSAVHS